MPRRWSRVAWKSCTCTGSFSDVVAELAGARRRPCPGRTPPPAIQTEKQRGDDRGRSRRGEFALGIVGAAEFAAPDDQGVLEQPALFEVPDQRGGGLVGLTALGCDAFGEVAVLIPALVVELDELDAAFGEAAGQEAVAGEGPGL
jgi:hypothetical protein